YDASLSSFINRTPTTQIYTLSLHDALPIFGRARQSPPVPARRSRRVAVRPRSAGCRVPRAGDPRFLRFVEAIGSPARSREESGRSEEHTSELQSPCNLVCRLLLEKKNKQYI